MSNDDLFVHHHTQSKVTHAHCDTMQHSSPLVMGVASVTNVMICARTRRADGVGAPGSHSTSPGATISAATLAPLHIGERPCKIDVCVYVRRMQRTRHRGQCRRCHQQWRTAPAHHDCEWPWPWLSLSTAPSARDRPAPPRLPPLVRPPSTPSLTDTRPQYKNETVSRALSLFFENYKNSIQSIAWICLDTCRTRHIGVVDGLDQCRTFIPSGSIALS